MGTTARLGGCAILEDPSSAAQETGSRDQARQSGGRRAEGQIPNPPFPAQGGCQPAPSFPGTRDTSSCGLTVAGWREYQTRWRRQTKPSPTLGGRNLARTSCLYFPGGQGWPPAPGRRVGELAGPWEPSAALGLHKDFHLLSTWLVAWFKASLRMGSLCGQASCALGRSPAAPAGVRI